MGIDYSAVGGIGFRITDKIQKLLVEKGIFTSEEMEDCPAECLDKMPCKLRHATFREAGDAYDGAFCYFLMVEGKTLGEITKNASAFCNSINQLNFLDSPLTPESLEVVEESYIW